MAKRVIILSNFRSGGRDYEKGQIFYLHVAGNGSGTRHPNQVLLTDDKNSFSSAVPEHVVRIISDDDLNSLKELGLNILDDFWK